jgi:hypothetical protein
VFVSTLESSEGRKINKTFQFSPYDAFHALPSTEARNFSAEQWKSLYFLSVFFACCVQTFFHLLTENCYRTMCNRNPNIIFRDADVPFYVVSCMQMSRTTKAVMAFPLS